MYKENQKEMAMANTNILVKVAALGILAYGAFWFLTPKKAKAAPTRLQPMMAGDLAFKLTPGSGTRIDFANIGDKEAIRLTEIDTSTPNAGVRMVLNYPAIAGLWFTFKWDVYLPTTTTAESIAMIHMNNGAVGLNETAVMFFPRNAWVSYQMTVRMPEPSEIPTSLGRLYTAAQFTIFVRLGLLGNPASPTVMFIRNFSMVRVSSALARRGRSSLHAVRG